MSLKRSLVQLANRALGPLPVAIENTDALAGLRAKATRLDWQAQLLEHAPSPETIPRAQLGQDLFALWANGFVRDGYFVEFGGADGVMLSNTVLLERSFGWNGIVAEPARAWHDVLRANRRCEVDTRCVWEYSGRTLTFAEPADPFLSTVNDYLETDGHGANRRESATYEVETVSLGDLLAEHDAPQRIDYLSVDTEGTEFEILRSFDFDRYDVRVLTVEHAYNPERRRLVYDLLTGKGFVRVLAETSLWDDWFVAPDLTLPARAA
jgi:FkbM family methyltransferase